ncbi:MAG: nucleotidyl transferase AbiEii/AbiGii toxin family protein [Spirochaeta sp.]|jgi:hypothetical protein|nr:nucleotidyl transferase AbiEii/AbiGii toxin family protein [Spirochaeta sp.]
MLEETFLRVARALSNRHITWGLAGGFAFSLYCRPRATVDIDIVLIGDLDAIEDALRDAFPSVYRNLETMQYPLVDVHRFLLIESENETVLDVLRPFDGSFIQFVSQGLRQIDFVGAEIPVVAPETLYALKRSSSRDRDKADVAELEACLGESLDYEAVAEWVEKG